MLVLQSFLSVALDAHPQKKDSCTCPSFDLCIIVVPQKPVLVAAFTIGFLVQCFNDQYKSIIYTFNVKDEKRYLQGGWVFATLLKLLSIISSVRKYRNQIPAVVEFTFYPFRVDKISTSSTLSQCSLISHL